MAVRRLKILNTAAKPGKFSRLVLAQGILLSLQAVALSGGLVYSSPNAVSSLPVVPPGLKSTFMVGLANQPDDLSWMTGSGAAWDARYQYLVGGVNNNPENNWSTWNSPAGQFATNYIAASASSGYLPVFTYYQIYQSGPGSGVDEAEKDYNNLNNPVTMLAYFADFKLLMDRIRLAGKTVLVHIEPDLWGFMQKRAANPQNISAAVASSGYADVAAYPNTVAGFAQALVGLRNRYAPNALLAYHISPWSSTYGDLASDTSAGFNTAGAAQETANFYNLTGANFDLLFYDIADRDAGYYQIVKNQPNRWWDLNNATYPNFTRFNQFAAAITAATGKRGMLWQIPVGNTLYLSMNNTTQHWQDNRVQYYLGADDNQKIQDLADAGIIGLLFGQGSNEMTSYTDAAHDGITNPAAINDNTRTAIYADDDGGNLRLRGKAYYTRGKLALANPPQNPAFTSNPANGAAVSLTASSGNPSSTNISVSNSGAAGSTLLVSAPDLGGSGAGSFSLSPSDGFSLSAGSAKTVSVTCNPQASGNLTASLSFATNDPARPTISYSLSCAVQVARFSSTPYAPGATIELTAQQNQTVSATINVSNTGGTGTALNVAAGQLLQQIPGIFTIYPTLGFSADPGGPAKTVTVNCTPTGTGVKYTGTLTFATNDPGQSSVAYNLTCNSPFAITVNSATDDGSGQPGTLSQALKSYAANQLINFAVAGNKIRLTGTALPAAGNGPVLIDGGSCLNGVPGLTIDGDNRAMDALTLGAGVQLRNVLVTNFLGRLIVASVLQGGGNNQLGKCVILRK